MSGIWWLVWEWELLTDGVTCISISAAVQQHAAWKHTSQSTTAVSGVGGAVGALLGAVAGIACKVSRSSCAKSVIAACCRMTALVVASRCSTEQYSLWGGYLLAKEDVSGSFSWSNAVWETYKLACPPSHRPTIQALHCVSKVRMLVDQFQDILSSVMKSPSDIFFCSFFFGAGMPSAYVP